MVVVFTHDKDLLRKIRFRSWFFLFFSMVLFGLIPVSQSFGLSNISFILTLIGGPIFVYCAALLPSIYDSRNFPFLELNREGVFDRTQDVYYGLIAWEDIIDLRLSEEYKDFIFIDVANTEKYLNQLIIPTKRYKGFYKNDLKNDFYGYGTAVFINVKHIQGSAEEIFEKILSYKNKTKPKILDDK